MPSTRGVVAEDGSGSLCPVIGGCFAAGDGVVVGKPSTSDGLTGLDAGFGAPPADDGSDVAALGDGAGVSWAKAAALVISRVARSKL